MWVGFLPWTPRFPGSRKCQVIKWGRGGISAWKSQTNRWCCNVISSPGITLTSLTCLQKVFTKGYIVNLRSCPAWREGDQMVGLLEDGQVIGHANSNSFLPSAFLVLQRCSSYPTLELSVLLFQSPKRMDFFATIRLRWSNEFVLLASLHPDVGR